MNYLYNPFHGEIRIASELGILQLRKQIRYELIGNLPAENRVIADGIFAMLLEHPKVIWYNSMRPDENIDAMLISEPWGLKTHRRYLSMVAAPNYVFVLSRVETKNFTTYYYGSVVKEPIINQAVRRYYIDLAIALAE